MFQSPNQPNPVKYLRLEQLTRRLSVSKSSIWSWVKKDDFPAPIKLSSNVTAWDIADILEWEAQRKSKKT